MEIHCLEKFRETSDYAVELGDTSFQNCIAKLESWEKREWCPCTIHLYNDRAPYSFFFKEVYADGRTGICGGLLYHGDPDESMAVTFNTTDRWQTHT